jgi:ubiquinone/menaquinone biosynthesis C-methylase UbiE
VASGDHLPMFADDELDYVVQRHNLEHYQDFIKAIQEWKRIVKPGGLIGMVVPDYDVCDTIRLDPTHKHAFTQHSLARTLDLVGGMRIISLNPLLKNWSFLCVAQKTQALRRDTGRAFDYKAAVRRFEQRQVMQRAQDYEKASNYKNSSESQTRVLR